MKSEEKQKVVYCIHCANETLMNCLFEYRQDWGSEINLEYGYDIYQLYQCPVCKEITLSKDYASSDHSEGTEVLFPADNIDYLKVPKNIKSAYQAAVKTKAIDKAICIQSLRRVLEMICKDKGAEGRTLVDKIQYLVSNNKLPDMVNDMCYIIRKMGNEAAHADDKEFSTYEVSEVIRYVGLIIEYLYSIPRRIQLLKNMIDEE